MTVNGSPKPGFTSGEAIKAIEEVAAQTLPTGYGYEFSGMTREEQSTGSSTTAIVFVLCIVFVYLLLSAQYESYILPLVVYCLFHWFGRGIIFTKFMGTQNDIYLQIALIMLIGLLAKNAILNHRVCSSKKTFRDECNLFCHTWFYSTSPPYPYDISGYDYWSVAFNVC